MRGTCRAVLPNVLVGLRLSLSTTANNTTYYATKDTLLVTTKCPQTTYYITAHLMRVPTSYFW